MNQKRYTFGLILSYSSTIITLLLTLVLTPIIIKALGQNEYGLYETIASFVNYLAILDLGFSAVVTRYTAKYQAENNIEMRNKFLYVCRNIYRILVLIIFVIGIVLSTSLPILFKNSFSPSEMSKANILFFIILFTTISSIYSQVYKGALIGLERFYFVKILHVVKTVFSKIVAILILFLGADSIGYVMVLMLFELLSFIIVKFYCKKYIAFVKDKFNFSYIKELIQFTLFIFLQAIVSQIYWQTDKLILGMTLGTSFVAIYAISLNLQQIITNVSSSVRDIIMPKAMSIIVKDNDQLKIENLIIKSSRVIGIFYMLMTLGFICFGKEFIHLWVGDSYEFAYTIVILLTVSSLIPTILGPLEDICRAYNKHAFLSVTYFISAIVNVVFSFILVHYMGILGVTLATAFSLFIGNTIIANLYYNKTLHFNMFRIFIKIFIRIGLVSIVVLCIGNGLNLLFVDYHWLTLFIKISIVVICYGGFILLFALNKEEKNSIMNIVKKGYNYARKRNI